MLFVIGPQRVVDDADAAALRHHGELGSEIFHRRRPQEPRRHGHRRSPFPRDRDGFDLGRQQARDRATLQTRERPGGQRRGLPVIRIAERFENRQENSLVRSLTEN